MGRLDLSEASKGVDTLSNTPLNSALEYIDTGLAREEERQEKKKINCDQVVWVKNALERLVQAAQVRNPAVSRQSQVAKLAALLEIMEVLGYEFEDKDAAGNALSDFREFNDMRSL